MEHRKDIDGLRAIAIAPVVLFHSGSKFFSGGFVGVDVFFVISGFLITSILYKNMQDGNYSILGFYERRARRILPALLAVCVFVMVFSAIFMLPVDFKEVPRSVISAIFFVSNIFFYLQAGYFDAASVLKPMLHTWSLGVEEQFYIFFPILMAFALPWGKRRLLLVVAVLALVSFLFSIWGITHKAWFSFYMIPARVWELFAGSLLALGFVPRPERRLVREGLALLGLGLILWAVFTFSSTTNFPGPNALFPVLGASLLLLAAPGTIVGAGLSVPPMVGLGLISYSLYLWHWPLIVFFQYLTIKPLGGWRTALVVVLSLSAAVLSWRFVEGPFRDRSRIPVRAFAFWTGFVAAVIGCAALVGVALGGWPSRFPPEALRLAGYIDDTSPTVQSCNRGDGYGPPLAKTCVYGASVSPHYAVFSDSHGIELSYALGSLARRYNESVLQYSYSSCLPVLKFHGSRDCERFREEVVRGLISNTQIHTIIIAGFYDKSDVRDSRDLPQALRSTVLKFTNAGKRVVLVYPIPNQEISIPRALARLEIDHRQLSTIGVDTSDFENRDDRVLRTLDNLSSDGVTAVRPDSLLCSKGICGAIRNGTPLYFDSNHLSLSGVRYILPLFDGIFHQENRPRQVSLSQQQDTRFHPN